MELQIANVVADSYIDDRLNLDIIKKSLENCEYEPEQYFALIYRLKYPKISILVNKSGKIIFTGAKNMNDIEAARKIFFNDLESLGYQPKIKPITIQNLIVVARYNYHLNLGAVFRKNSNKFIGYNQRKANRLVFKHIDPKFTALIFKSGNILIVGLKNFFEIEKALNIIERFLPEDCR